MITFKEKLFRKSVLFVVGFCLYITIETCFRGYSYPLMGILGGLFLLIIDPINDRIRWDIDILLYGCIGSAIITTMELVVGETIKLLGLTQMWDYSNLPLNFDGVICVPFSILWIGMSIIGIFIADAINYYVFEDTEIPHYVLFGRIILFFKIKKCQMNPKHTDK